MITDDERREVARRLMDEVGCVSSWPGMERLGLILGIKREPRTGWEGRILTRLADLIYPCDMSQGRRDIVACDREALLELAEDVEEAAAMAVAMDSSEGTKLLADLIEPTCDRDAERTCRVGCYPPGYEDNLHYEVCSECGTILTASRPGDSHAARASYRPSCGAKVVDE